MKSVIFDAIKEYLKQENVQNRIKIADHFINLIDNEQNEYYSIIRNMNPKKLEQTDISRKIRFDSMMAHDMAIAGTDEVGRGCIFGPVFTATAEGTNACKLDHPVFAAIDDSKRLTSRLRKSILFFCIEKNIEFSIGFSTVNYIEKNNILNATINAIKMSINNIAGNGVFYLIDGRFPVDFGPNTKKVVKGDSKSFVIGLASIIAKTVRDYLMATLSLFYPGYFLERNMGYGTKDHFLMISRKGYTELHRKSFLRRYLAGKHQGTLIQKQENQNGI